MAAGLHRSCSECRHIKDLMCLMCEVLRLRLMEAHLVTTGNKAALVKCSCSMRRAMCKAHRVFTQHPEAMGMTWPPWTLQTIQKMEQKFRILNLYSLHATCSANASKKFPVENLESVMHKGDAHSSGKKRLQTAEIRTNSPSPNPPPCPSGRGMARQETRALQGNTHPCN